MRYKQIGQVEQVLEIIKEKGKRHWLRRLQETKTQDYKGLEFEEGKKDTKNSISITCSGTGEQVPLQLQLWLGRKFKDSLKVCTKKR